MKVIRLSLVGFGNVGRALVELLAEKQETLRSEYGFTTLVSGIATRQHGMAIDENGIDIEKALQISRSGGSLNPLSSQPILETTDDFIHALPADVLFENSPVDQHHGQPAINHLRTALECGMHAITANKGAVVYGFDELTTLAQKNQRRFLFESTVMDGAPIFSLFRTPLPASELISFYGILNSCTNLLLERMESGDSLEAAVAYGQSIGITETDPSADIDGWDAAIKVAALVKVLMGKTLTPPDVQREGIRNISPAMVTEALAVGERWKLVCSAQLIDGVLKAQVAPQRVNSLSPLYSINGTSSFVQFQLDTLPGLGILESNPGPKTTAYGLLADLINALKG